MTTPEELLRLARKAWPDEEGLVFTCRADDEILVEDGYGYTQACVKQHARCDEAMHAALLVLAGELDVAALLAERDSALELLDSLIADDLHHIGWRAAWRRFRQLWTGTRWTAAEQAAGHTG